MELLERAAPLVRDVVHHERAAREGQLPVVAVVRLQVDGHARGVPVVGHEEERLVAVGRAAAGDGPGRLERGLAEERVAEEDVLPVPAVDVARVLLEGAVVDEDKVDAACEVWWLVGGLVGWLVRSFVRWLVGWFVAFCFD